MVRKRLIACLDVHGKKVTKGIKFQGNEVVGEPIELANKYSKEGIDELVFYDITASKDNRSIDLDMVRNVAKNIFIPFSVGGGIRNVEDMYNVLLAGAEKVSVNSLAVKQPEIISQGANLFGRQCIVLGVDVRKNTNFPSGYQVVIKGGREKTNLDALEWILKAESLGAGEVCVNSIDADGTKDGYNLDITGKIARACQIPVIASGGAGNCDHLINALKETEAEAVLVASMLHYGTYTIANIKKELFIAEIPVRI